jgi:outer membrane receptor protein involved in Fe transport
MTWEAVMNTSKHPLKRLLVMLTGILTLLGSTIALGGTTGKISGRVLDKKGEALPSTNVVVMGTSLGSVTDLEGYYSILNIPPGRYQIQFRLVGYRTLSVKEVQVTADKTTKLDGSMEEDAITTDAVVVTAKRPVVDVNLTSSISTVTDKDILALPVQELQDIVNLQAGVVDGHFRGGRAGEVQYQVNGVSVNNAYDNSSTIKIDRSLIQEVQVITGTFDAEYGQAMSGVVNTVLKSGGENFSWNAEALAGSFLYSSGGFRNLTYKFRPEFLNQNYQLSINGPTGIPQTYFLVSGRRNVFTDYFLGERRFNPLDTVGLDSNPAGWLTNPNGDGKVVALGYSREWSGLGKITNRSLPGIELSYQVLVNRIDASSSSDAFTFRFNPDGKKKQQTTSFVHGLDLTHTLSATTYYNLSVRQNYFDYHDWVFDDFYDPRYDYARSSGGLFDYEYGASVLGVDFGRFRQKTNTLVLKGAVTSQVTRAHQVKLGFEVQTSRLEYGTAGTLTYKGDTLYRYENLDPDYPGVQYSFPASMAAYLQDQMEWNDLTIRAGLRFEYFDARSTVPSDLANPANAIQGAPLSVPRRTTKKISYAPRIGLSYPITATSSIFFSYGHFYQFPPLRDIFANANYGKLANLQDGTGNFDNVYANPDIKPERTIQYEFGYKNAVTEYLGVSLNLFYKDIRDLLGVEFIDTYTSASYARKTNVDFGNVTGFTISLDQRRVGILSSTLDYTWQMAQGNSSDPNETANRAKAGEDPRPRQVPLNWDQRHTLNMTVQLSEPEKYSISTILRFGSGQPYTPEIGSGFGSGIEKNSGRKPNGFVVDFRAEKYVALAGINMSVFLRVFNLLDARYYNGSVIANTGSPDYGLFPLSQDKNTLADPTRYYAPRRIELGISMNSSF